MNKNYVTDVLMIFKCPINSPEDPCKFTPKISGVLLQNLVRPYIYFRGFDVTSNKTFLEQKLSLCSVDKKAGLNIFIRLLLDQVTEFIKFDCPIQKVRSSLNFHLHSFTQCCSFLAILRSQKL